MVKLTDIIPTGEKKTLSSLKDMLSRKGAKDADNRRNAIMKYLPVKELYLLVVSLIRQTGKVGI